MVRLRIRGLEKDESGDTLDFDLRQILDALGARAVALRWRCAGLSYTSIDERDIEVLDRITRPGQSATGRDLIDGAQRLLQVIDGEFTGTDGVDACVVVRVVDSSFWELESGDVEFVDAIRSRFARVETIVP